MKMILAGSGKNYTVARKFLLVYKFISLREKIIFFTGRNFCASGKK